MVDGLVTTAIVVALLTAAVAGLAALRDRPPGWWQLGGLAAVVAVLLVQAAVAVGRMVTGDRPDQIATFLGYLLTTLLLPPLAVLLGWSERTRWGSALVAAAGVVVAVLVVRLQQVWHA